MSVRARVAVKTVLWLTGFALVIALAAVGGRLLTTALDDTGPGRGSRNADGVVVAERRAGGGLGSAPLEEVEISFATADGERRTFWESGRADIGEKVTVRYDPENPDNAGTFSAANGGVGAAVTIVAGVALVIGPSFFFVRLAWTARRRAAQA